MGRPLRDVTLQVSFPKPTQAGGGTRLSTAYAEEPPWDARVLNEYVAVISPLELKRGSRL